MAKFWLMRLPSLRDLEGRIHWLRDSTAKVGACNMSQNHGERENEREREEEFSEMSIYSSTHPKYGISSVIVYKQQPLSIENNIDASLSWTKNNEKKRMKWIDDHPPIWANRIQPITVMWSSCDLGYPLGTGRLQDCGSASGRPWNGPQSVEVSLVIWPYGSIWSFIMFYHNQQSTNE